MNKTERPTNIAWLRNTLQVEDEFFELDKERLTNALVERLSKLDWTKNNIETGDCPCCGDDNWSIGSTDTEYSCGTCGLLEPIATEVWNRCEKIVEED